jgi:hypothetical protein
LKKTLPQFNSLEEAQTYFSKYGKLEYFGRGGHMYEYCIYNYKVKDGRLLRINIYNNGKVEERIAPKLPPNTM